MQWPTLWSAAALVLLLVTPVHAAAAEDGPSPEALATTFVEQLAAGDFDSAVGQFDATMAAAMSTDQLAIVWGQIVAGTGAFKAVAGTRTDSVQGYTVVFVTCEFDKDTLDVKAVYSEDDAIAGLFFVPTVSGEPAPFEAAPYVDPASFIEQEVQVTCGRWILPGTLTLPVAEGPHPAVVLVHGSGPQDRDETMGPNRPFADLAGGLASRGIAALRYDKRTLVYKGDSADDPAAITVQHETIDDALAAVALLRGTDGIDGARIYVVGHSLGGLLAPRIGAHDPELAGMAILAGPTRPTHELLVEQFNYLFNLDGEIIEVEQASLDQAAAWAELLGGDGLTAETPAADLPFGVPASYWLDLKGYDPAATAAALTMPLLVLQGERDYQVTMEDYAGWQKGLEGREGATLRSYPDLNHLFMAGEGESTPDEYDQPGHVADVVIDHIVRWILDTAP